MKSLFYFARKAGVKSLSPGDIVECMNVDDLAGPWLEVGKEYVIDQVDANLLYIRGVHMACVSSTFRKKNL